LGDEEGTSRASNSTLIPALLPSAMPFLVLHDTSGPPRIQTSLQYRPARCDYFQHHVHIDVAVFAPLKEAYRAQVDRLERGGVNTIGKQHFTSLFSPARMTAFTPKNIKAGFAASGLFPFNPDRVLRNMPMPPAEPAPAVPRADKMTVGSCRQDVELLIPETPVTPMLAEALMSLQNRIIH